MAGVKATIRWSRLICKEPGNYICCPTIARKEDGELLVVFSGDREEHACPYGKTELIRSRDGGEAWSRPETINNTPLDDRDPGIIVLRSGTIVVSWFTRATGWEELESYREDRRWSHYVDEWERHCRKIPQEARERWLGNWTRRSSDGGRTWEPAVDSIASASHGPIQLHDGRLLYVGTGILDGRRAQVSAESIDEARSWQLIGRVPVAEEDTEELFLEPHPVELPDGRIVCLWRYRQDSYLRQSESTDGGRTWTVTHSTPIWGFPPHLIRLHNGDILAAYGHRRSPYGQRACLSHDGGQTWDIDNEIVLRDDAPSGYRRHRDLGYPVTIELKPMELLTVYYQIDSEGEKPSLSATRWSLD